MADEKYWRYIEKKASAVEQKRRDKEEKEKQKKRSRGRWVEMEDGNARWEEPD